MYMVWTRFDFYHFYTLLLTQFSQYRSYILFYLAIYLHPSILGDKYGMILTSPTCMLQTTYIFIFHDEDLPVIVVVWSANHFYLIRDFFYFPPRYKLFFLRLSPGMSLVTSNQSGYNKSIILISQKGTVHFLLPG